MSFTAQKVRPAAAGAFLAVEGFDATFCFLRCGRFALGFGAGSGSSSELASSSSSQPLSSPESEPSSSSSSELSSPSDESGWNSSSAGRLRLR